MQRLSRRGYAPFALSGQHMPYLGFPPSHDNARRQGAAPNWHSKTAIDEAHFQV